MTLAQYNKLKKSIEDSIELNKETLIDIKELYIKTNAPHPPGTKLLISDYGKTFEVTVDYEVKDGLIVAKFKTLQGHHVFTNKPEIIKTI